MDESVEIFDLATAIAAALTAQAAIENGFPQKCSASAMFVPIYEPVELKECKLSVVGRDFDEVLIARGPRVQETYNMDVAVQRTIRLSADKQIVTEDMNAMMKMTKAVKNFLKGEDFTVGGIEFVWIKTSNAPIYSVKHARMGFFTSVLTLSYRVAAV